MSNLEYELLVKVKTCFLEKRNWKNIFFIFSFVSLLTQTLNAQNTSVSDSTKKVKKVNYAGLALPAKSPENGFYVNGGLMGVFKTDRIDSTLRASNLYVFGLYSQLRQYRISTGGDIFTKNENYYLNGWYYYSYLPELYFGIGNNGTPDSSEFISYRMWHMNTNVLRRVYGKWFTGITHTFENLRNLSVPLDGIAYNNSPIGMRPHSLSGAGIKVRYDSRDNILSSNTGLFVETAYTLFKPGIGSSFNFEQFSFDARKFINITPKKYNILAFNLLVKHSGGDTPFRYLSNISARGYHPNMYRDNSLISLQGEYRFRIWNWFGMSLFGGASEVASSFDKMNAKNVRENYGGGLRFRIFKANNMYLRMEYGRSSNTSNVYISFSDAF